MEQNRLKSPVFWICTIITVAYIALEKLGILGDQNITAQTVSDIGAIVTIIATLFNGANNPKDPSHF